MGGSGRRRRCAFTLACALAMTLVGVGCASAPTRSAPIDEAADCPAADPSEPGFVEVYRRAETDRGDRLAQEVARLKDDLKRAEEALVIAESDLAGMHGRADAVSSIAEARIQVDRAARRAPWRADQASAAADKLEEAERQLGDGHFGAALFFTYRARRVAAEILAEADQVEKSSATRFVNARKVNLRSGPSTSEPVVGVLEQGTPVFTESRRGAWLLVRVTGGPAGWVHSGLLRSHFERDRRTGPASPEDTIAP